MYDLNPATENWYEQEFMVNSGDPPSLCFGNQSL